MEEHYIASMILHHLAGGLIALASASLASHFGIRAAERLPGESFLPQCLFCQRPLEWFEAFPLFGWLLRKNFKDLPCPCGKRTGMWLQPLTEVIGMFLGVMAINFAGWDTAAIPLCLGLGLLPAIASIDVAYGIIPDALNALLAIFGVSWLFLVSDDIFMGFIGSALLLLLGITLALGYSRLRGKEMLGLGDVKFFAAAGIWLPLELIPWFLALAGIIGVITGLLWRTLEYGSKEFPFAPALCVSLATCIFYVLF